MGERSPRPEMPPAASEPPVEQGADKEDERGAEAAPETRAEAEPLRREFEYRDADGKVIGRAEAEFDPEVWEFDRELAGGQRLQGSGRRLRKFVMRGEKDGKPAEIDVMELANPYGVDVIVADDRLDNYAYFSDDRETVTAPLETPLDVGVMLHELGHGSQFHEERFEELKKLYGIERGDNGKKKPLTYERMREIIEAVVDVVPEAEQVLDPGTMEELDRLQEKKIREIGARKRLEAAFSEQHDHREGEFAEFIASQMRGFDAEKFAQRCDLETDLLESSVKKTWEVRSVMKSIVGDLEKAGFRLPATREDSYKEAPLKVLKRGVEVEYPPLPRSMISHPEEAAKLIRGLFVNTDFDFDQTTMEYSSETGKLTIRFPLDCVTEFRGFSTTLVIDADDDEYESYRRQRERSDEVIKELDAEVRARKDTIEAWSDAQRAVLKDMSADDIIALPTRMLERDATRRALQWMRKIRQVSGVNLFAAHKVEPAAKVVKKPASAKSCAASTAAGMSGDDSSVEAKVLEDLKDALKSYGADRLRLKPSGGGTGITPMPGGHRTST